MKYRLGIDVIFFYLVTRVDSMLEDGKQKYFKYCQINKKAYIILDDMRYYQIALPKLYIDKGEEINYLF